MDVIVRCPSCCGEVTLADEDVTQSLSCPTCNGEFTLAEDVDDSLETKQVLGRFQLLGKLGAGAFGTVWKARDPDLDRLVALKVPRKNSLSPADVEQFVREARAVAQIEHPNIVSVHEVGRDGDQIFLVMDFVDGEPLNAWTEDRRFSIAEAASLMVKVASAVHHAHESGVVHRDLKPSNIMLDRDLEPKVTDFGLAKRDAGEVTMTSEGELLGTPAYMSPEQARGDSHQADARSDVYALGVIIFKLTTGELPFRGNVRMLLHQVLHEEPPSPRKFNSSIPRDFETICLKCLQKVPEKRYSTADGLVQDLRRMLKREPIQARPISATERTLKWIRRKPLVSSLLVVLFVALTAIIAGGASYNARLVDSNERSEEAILVAQNREREAKAARDQAQAARDREAELREKFQLQYVESSFRQALGEFEQNDSAAGLLWLVEALENCPNVADANSTKTAIRRNISEWSNRLFALDSAYKVPKLSKLAISPGQRTAVATDGSSGWLIDLKSGRKKSFSTHHHINDVKFSPKGDLFATVGMNRQIRFWDAKSARPVGRPMGDLPSLVLRVAFSADGRVVAAAGMQGGRTEVKAYDRTSGMQVGETMMQAGQPTAIRFSADGQKVIVSSAYVASVYDVKTGRKDLSVRHDDWVSAVAFHPTRPLVITSGSDRTVRTWDSQSGDEIGPKLQLESAITSMSISGNGDVVLVGCRDKRAYLWQIPTRKLYDHPLQNGSSVQSVYLSPDGNTAIAGARDGEIRIFRRSPRSQPIVHPYPRPFQKVAVDATGQRILVGQTRGLISEHEIGDFRKGTDHIIHVHNIRGRSIRALEYLDDQTVMSAVSPSYYELPGKKVVELQIWDKSTGKLKVPPILFERYLGFARRVPQASTFVVSKNDETQFFRIADGKPSGLKFQGLGGRCSDAGFSPDGSLIAIAGAPNPESVGIYDVKSAKQSGQNLKHDRTVRVVRFSRDGKFLVTGGDDTLVRIWNVADASLRHLLRGNKGSITDLDVSSDGSLVVSGCDDGTVRRWDVATGKPVGPVFHFPSPVNTTKFVLRDRLVVGASSGKIVDPRERNLGRVMDVIYVIPRVSRSDQDPASLRDDLQRRVSRRLDGQTTVPIPAVFE